ncbi:MAG: histidine phosphatase family protein [Thermoleophilia bacterium]|nr:histidine phosphatase family protein [Thermoleophilia bacterium]
MKPKQVYLIRHGETEGTSAGRFVGSTDLPLTAHGRNQVLRLAGSLPAGLFAPGAATWCAASPLLRAQETAAAVVCPHGLAFETDPDLREIDFGAWEGLTAEEIEARFPGALDMWSSPGEAAVFPGGENSADFDRRVARVCGRIVEQGADAALVFAHGGVVRAVVCALLGLGRANLWMLDVRPASVVRVTLFEDRAILSGLWSADDHRGG